MNALNPDALALIKHFEGLRLVPYKDQAGILTVGYGHVLKPGDPTGPITEEQAEQFLVADLADAEYDVRHFIHPDVLNENRFGALVSLTFNEGPKPLYLTLGQKLNGGDILGASDQFLLWNKVREDGNLVPSAGLTERRRAERMLFLKPVMAINNGVTQS